MDTKLEYFSPTFSTHSNLFPRMLDATSSRLRTISSTCGGFCRTILAFGPLDQLVTRLNVYSLPTLQPQSLIAALLLRRGIEPKPHLMTSSNQEENLTDHEQDRMQNKLRRHSLFDPSTAEVERADCESKPVHKGTANQPTRELSLPFPSWQLGHIIYIFFAFLAIFPPTRIDPSTSLQTSTVSQLVSFFSDDPKNSKYNRVNTITMQN